ncbi:unnamed protein product, partial [Closterium sp. NIES-54]
MKLPFESLTATSAPIRLPFHPYHRPFSPTHSPQLPPVPSLHSLPTHQLMEDIRLGLEVPDSTHQHPPFVRPHLPHHPTPHTPPLAPSPPTPHQLMEDIRLGLEVPDSTHQQRRITALRFLGELYSYRVVDSHLVFDTLHLLLFFGADTPE